MGSSTSYFLAFLLGAAIPSACVVVLLPSLCSRAGVGVIPAQQLARNATQATDRGVNELVTLVHGERALYLSRSLSFIYVSVSLLNL